MRVSCPSCNTAYNIDDAKIPATGANLKCAKCKTSFPVKREGAPAAPKASAPVPLPGGAAPPKSAAVPLPGGKAPPAKSAAVPLPGGAPPPLPKSGAVPLPGGKAPAAKSAAVPLPGGRASNPMFAAANPYDAEPDAPASLPPADGHVPFADGGATAVLPSPKSHASPPSPAEDPFGAPPPGDDPFGLPPAPAGEDPFGMPPPPAGEDPFGAPPADPYGAPPTPAEDPFGAPPADPYGAPPAAAEDPFGAPPAPAGEDPFGAPPQAAADPFGAPAAAPQDDPFAAMDFSSAPPAPEPRSAATAAVAAPPSLGFGEVDFGGPPPAAPSKNLPQPGAAGSELDFLNMEEPKAAPRPKPAPKPEDLEFDPTAKPDALEADLGAPLPAGPAPTASATNDLELLDFIDDAGAGKDAGKKVRASSLRYQIRRKSGKVFGPFEQAAIVKMLEEGQLLGNEDVSTDSDAWVPIGSIQAFAAAIQKLMESPGGLPGMAAGPSADLAGATDGKGASAEAALERMKALYGDRMAAIAVVDSAAADQRFKKFLPLIILGALSVVVLGVGLYLGTTPYGFFGMRRLFPSHLSKGSAAWAKFAEASKALNEDTFEGYQRALNDSKSLLAQKESAVEPRALFVQSVFYLKRRFYAGDEHLAQAKRYLDELELSAKDDPEVIKARAGYHLLKGEEGKIRSTIESAITKTKGDVELLNLLAESYLRERNTTPAAEALKRALAADPKNAKALHVMGLVKTLEKNPDYKAALELFQQALQADPRHLSSAVEIAAIQLQKLDEPEGAADVLSKTLSDEARKLLAPSDQARAHYLMGMLHAARHQQEEAIKEFELALKAYPDSAPANAAYGRFLLRRHDYVRAVELFDRAYKSDAKEMEYLDGLVRAQLGAGKPLPAQKLVTEAIANFPGNPRVAFLQGRVAEEVDKGDEAERNYRRAAEGDKAFWEAPLYMGNFFLKRRRVEDAKKAFAEALARAPNRPDAHVGQGNYLLATGAVAEAKAEFLTALKLDPESTGGHFGLAQVLVTEGSVADARKEYETVLRIDPLVPQLFTQYGTLLWQQKELDAAAAALEKAKNADPKDAAANWKLAAVYFEQGKLPEALKNVEASLFLEPSPDAYFYKARIHYEKRENNQAIEAIKSALERSSARPELHNLRGAIMYQAGKFGDAVDSWQRAVKLKPDYADALEALAKGYQEQGDYNRAIQYYEKTMGVDPKRIKLLVSVADCLLNLPAYDKAIAKYQEALEADPTVVGVYYKIGRCYDAKGKTDKAIEHYLKAIAKDPDAKEAWRFLGYAYKEKGRKADAVKAFKKYLEASPEAGDAKEIATEIYDLGGGG